MRVSAKTVTKCAEAAAAITQAGKHVTAKAVATAVGISVPAAAVALAAAGYHLRPGRPRTDLAVVRRAVAEAIAANGGRRPPLWRLARMTGFSEHAIRRALREAAQGSGQGGSGNGAAGA